jgi:hypothetical protein
MAVEGVGADFFQATSAAGRFALGLPPRPVGKDDVVLQPATHRSVAVENQSIVRADETRMV